MRNFGIFVLGVLLSIACFSSSSIKDGENGEEGKEGQHWPYPCIGGCSEEIQRPEPLPRPQCPENAPQVGDNCDHAGLICTYGNSPNAECRRTYECNVTWKVPPNTPPSSSMNPCYEVPEGYCPPQAPEHDSECIMGPAGARQQPCEYGELNCYCYTGHIGYLDNSGSQGSPGVWGCYGPPEDPACPADLPNIGEGCDTPGTQCNYHFDGCISAEENYVFCHEGVWGVGGYMGGCFL
jgi:hypothetical protein